MYIYLISYLFTLFVATDLATGAPGPVGTARGADSLLPVGEAEEEASIPEEEGEVETKMGVKVGAKGRSSLIISLLIIIINNNIQNTFLN